ncbi:8742_t:CDS:2 [Racocetra fulgida]|uniref:8742_t:CDS:1 n=1 Tax=Racocetra fulgida TaxID=60492 RepID=A0A9N8ZWR8_9GLOM|nr:8742_t:CDS:2 [Racocetra fulgida]
MLSTQTESAEQLMPLSIIQNQQFYERSTYDLYNLSDDDKKTQIKRKLNGKEKLEFTLVFREYYNTSSNQFEFLIRKITEAPFLEIKKRMI